MRVIRQLIPALKLCLFSRFRICRCQVKPPAEGGVLPEIVLNVPENSEHQQYLGVTGKKYSPYPK